tara:strand:+ start:3425 stop:4636 length:1212 start_codon:yes stop_codon:yes gene_type:complete
MSFQSTFHKILIILLVLLSILFFTLANVFTSDYFVQFSPDNTLKPSTISRINTLQSSLLVTSTVFLLLIIPLLYFNKSVKSFLKKHKTIIQNISLLIVILLVLFIVSELAFKAVFNETTFGPGFGPGTLNFNKKYVHINNDGMREEMNYQIQKPKDTIRIAAIGDSYSFGSGIKDVTNTYPKLLESSLNNQFPDKNYQVLNFGIPGKDTEAELDILEQKALKYDPDIVLIGYVLNDFKNVDPKITQKAHLTIIPGIGFWLRNFFYSYSFFEIKANGLLENLKLKPSKNQILLMQIDSEKNRDYNEALFARLKRISKENDFQVVIAIFPAMFEFDNYQFSDVHNFVKQQSQQNDFLYMDLLDVYKQEPIPELVVNAYDPHPNEKGHRIAKNYILENLINNQIVK